MATTYDAIIIGTGQAGPSLAVRLASTGMKVAIIERKRFGGTCVNNGCIPTKTLVASARGACRAQRDRPREFHMKTIRIIVVLALMAASGLALHAAQVRQSEIKRTDLLRHDLSVPGREIVQVRVDFAPGVAFGRHSHPGEEIAYVLEGSLEYQFDGKPPVTLKAGDALFIPAGTIHSAKNVGKINGAELATYVVEKGKPLVVPAK